MMLDLQILRLNYSIRRNYVDEYMMREVALFPQGSRVLDLGGHRVGKRGRFDIGQYDVETVHLNISTEKMPDIQADGAALPLASGLFDAVICTEVLEHVPDPRLLIQESCRVLRSGGRFVATVPFLYRIHSDPYDYGRYTDYYWNQVLLQQGFENVEVRRHGFFYSVILDYLKQYLSKVGFGSRIGTLIRRLLFILIVVPLQPWLLHYDQQHKVKDNAFLSSFTTGFGITATKR